MIEAHRVRVANPGRQHPVANLREVCRPTVATEKEISKPYFVAVAAYIVATTAFAVLGVESAA